MDIKKWIQRTVFLGVCFCMAAVAVWSESAGGEMVTVTIDQAEKTEYLKDTETDEEVIRFTGDVSLSVENQGSKIVIQAENVTFNRARATVYASGNVVFEQGGAGKKSEKLTADTLLFNTRTLSGVFDNGRVVQDSSGNINVPAGSVLVVFADTFGRESSGTVTFRNGMMTFCDEPEPHWKINASRIWLLPGNEFSIFSGLLYVGHFPVMYIPFFYYPKDEMIFNPVFGFDSRKGYFTQTTTYLIGRKGFQESSGSDADNGIFDFMKNNSLKEQVREGLFLHNLDSDAVMPSESLKILVDVYSNLGFMAGIEGQFKPKQYFTDISFGSYLGFSRTLFPVSSTFGSYTTFSRDNSRISDTGWILGYNIPFRFASNFETKFNLKPFSFTLKLPLYSDPFFTSDFLSTRSENMDWINFLMNNVVVGQDSSSGSSSNLSNYTWSFSGSVSSPSFLSALKPWINDFSINSQSQIYFSSKDNVTLSDEIKHYNPNRIFYYPSKVTPFKVDMRVSGKVLSIGSNSPGKTSSRIAGLEMPDVDDGKLTDENDSGIVPADAQLNEDSGIDLMTVPGLTIPKNPSVSLPGFVWDITYNIKPSVETIINYDSSNFPDPDTISWNESKNTSLQIKSPISLKSTSSWRGGFIGLTNSVDFSPVYQSHLAVSEKFYADRQDDLRKLIESDLKAQTASITESNSLTIKPFQYVNGLSGSSFSWNSGVKLLRREFTGTVENPLWENKVSSWDKDSFSSHNVTAVLSATQQANRFKENLTVKINLPPLARRIDVSASVVFPYCSSFAVSTGLKEGADTVWVREPLNQSSSWSFFDKKLSVTQSYRFNIEESRNESLSVSLSGYGASISYNMLYTTPYTFERNRGWIAESEKKFLPSTVQMRYILPSKEWKYLDDTIFLKPSVSSSLSMDLIRPTQSSFTITSGITFRITDFLDVTISSESQNKVVYRYLQNFGSSGISIPGETNAVLDLLNSFAFWNTSLRENSGFKLRNFAITVNHDLHDWTLHSEFKMAPRLVKENNQYRYDYSPYFTLSVQWKPMGSIKTTIQDKYGEFVLNPTEN